MYKASFSEECVSIAAELTVPYVAMDHCDTQTSDTIGKDAFILHLVEFLSSSLYT